MNFDDPEIQSLMSDWYGSDTSPAINEQSTRVMDRFFENLEVQAAIGGDAAPTIAKESNDEWDVWFSAEASDCPPEGAGCYKRVGGKLVKVPR